MTTEHNTDKGSKRFRAARFALAYAVFSVSWIVLSGLFLKIAVEDAVLQGRLEIAKGLVFVLATSGLLYFLLTAWHARLTPTGPGESAAPPVGLHRLMLICAALLLAVPLAGFVVIKLHAPTVEEKALSHLTARAALTARQVEHWMEGRLKLAEAMRSHQGLMHQIADLHRRREATPTPALRDRLETLRRAYGFDGLFLLDTQGRTLIRPHGDLHLSETARALLSQARKQHAVQSGPLTLDAWENLHVDFVVPLRFPGRAAPMGAIVLHVDPEPHLLDFLQHASDPLSTEDSLLARRTGDDVILLSPRHVRDAARRQRVVLSQRDHPAVLAVQRGGAGTVQGVNDGGESVLAAYRPVAGTGWVLITQVEQAAVMQALTRLGWWVTGVTFFALLAICLILMQLWRQQRRTHELALNDQAQHFIRHFYNLPFLGMVIVSSNRKRLLKCNDTFCEMLGYERDVLLTMTWFGIAHPQEREAIEQSFAQLHRGETDGFVNERRFLRQDGRIVVATVNVQCVRQENGRPQYFVMTLQDISLQKQNEARIDRLTRLYAALSHTNQAIVRCVSETELFPEICRVAVTLGGMKMAWIGMVDAATGQVVPVASYGDENDYLKDIPISTNPDEAIGRGPAGTAINTGQPVWCQDFLKEPIMAPWHQRAAQAGFGAVATLPLRQRGQVVGVFVLYASEADAFDQAARDLLEEMATDVSFGLDNFERERARQQAEGQLLLASKVFENSGEAFLITDAQERILMVNRAFCMMTGFTEAEVLGQTPRIVGSGHQPKAFYRAMWESIAQHGHWQGEVLNRKKDGSLYVAWLSISRVTDDAGTVTQYIGTASDITQHKANEERMDWLAHFDTLTGLPNRTLLEDRCRHAISMSQRNERPLALMFLDLDHFKHINDSLGYRLGDTLLTALGQRLSATVREQDTVSRLGGDDFVIVLPGTDADGAARLAEKLLHAALHPFLIEQNEFTVTASIGIAMYPENGDSLESLSRSADAAMYSAKREGRNTFRFFTPAMQAHSLRKLQLENALRRALDSEQFSLHYQPQIDLGDGTVVGAEVLLRWQHPAFGMIPPDEFIPIAESSGLILPIGEWVLRTAARQMRAWHQAGLALKRLAINLSAVQFRQANLPEAILAILADVGLDPACLELELTESTAMEDVQAASAMMARLHAGGMRVSIDDFGTGYSSLAHLKRFQAYKLKIDRAFVRDMASDADDRAIVAGIIHLAASLGLRTLAEGVENEAQRDFLREKGCDEIQGYLIARPQAAASFEAFLREHLAQT